MDEQNKNIVLLTDLQEAKLHKEEEIAFYQAQLDILQARLASVQREIQLTTVIMKQIESEKLVDIAHYMKACRLIDPND